jgi:hypothetical protein
MKQNGHLVVSREPGWVIVHATQIDVDDLICVCNLLGVIKNEK